MSKNSKFANIFAKYSGYPSPSILWRDIHGHDIKQELSNHNDELTFLPVSTDELGNYTLFAHNNQTCKEVNIQVTNIRDEPTAE